MITSKRVAFALVVAVHFVLLYILSTAGGHLMRFSEANKPVSVTLIWERPTPIDKASRLQHDMAPAVTSNYIVATRSLEAFKAPEVASAPIVVEPKDIAVLPPTNPSGVSLTQLALNAAGKLDQDERRSARSGANVMSNSLEARLSATVEKYGQVKAGTIDEHIYPDGRREERVHTLFGGEYCITFESPSNPTDGFDTMQRGLRPSVPHTCGHRFD